MINNIFLKGLIIGISMAAPVGPISILCIRRSITGGHFSGIATALGVALADGFYALVAAFGLTALSAALITLRPILYIFGGSLLFYIGYTAYTTKIMSLGTPVKKTDFFTTLFQTTVITLANPMTILTFLAAFAAVGVEKVDREVAQALLISAGVMCGSAAWFLSMSFIVSSVRTRVTPTVFLLINKVSGFILMVFGAYFFLSGIVTQSSALLSRFGSSYTSTMCK